jgi:hypothetical protein
MCATMRSRNCHLLATFAAPHASRHGVGHAEDAATMTDTDFARKLAELDRLLNDPEVPLEPAKVWSLLAEISYRDLDAQRQRTAE